VEGADVGVVLAHTLGEQGGAGTRTTAVVAALVFGISQLGIVWWRGVRVPDIVSGTRIKQREAAVC
jgi:L-lactate permease